MNNLFSIFPRSFVTDSSNFWLVMLIEKLTKLFNTFACFCVRSINKLWTKTKFHSRHVNWIFHQGTVREVGIRGAIGIRRYCTNKNEIRRSWLERGQAWWSWYGYSLVEHKISPLWYSLLQKGKGSIGKEERKSRHVGKKRVTSLCFVFQGRIADASFSFVPPWTCILTSLQAATIAIAPSVRKPSGRCLLFLSTLLASHSPFKPLSIIRMLVCTSPLCISWLFYSVQWIRGKACGRTAESGNVCYMSSDINVLRSCCSR